MERRKMKILVTGAAGLIGSHLCDLLLDGGHIVTGVDDLSYGKMDNLYYAESKPNFVFINRTIDESTIFANDYDFIYHLASYKKTFGSNSTFNHSCDFSDVMLNNSKMINFLFNGDHKNSNIIFTSTSDVYGDHDSFGEYDDLTFQHPLIQRQSYALVKLFEEQVLLNAHQEGKLNVAIARIFGCVSDRSGRDWSGGHIPLFIEQAKNNKPIELHGGGSQTRSIAYAPEIAEDLVRMMYKFNMCNGNITNIGSSEELTVRQHAEMIIEATDSKSKLIDIPAESVFGGYKDIKRRKPNLYLSETRINSKSKTKFKGFLSKLI